MKVSRRKFGLLVSASLCYLTYEQGGLTTIPGLIIGLLCLLFVDFWDFKE